MSEVQKHMLETGRCKDRRLWVTARGRGQATCRGGRCPRCEPSRVRGEAICRGQRRWALRQGLHAQLRSGQPCAADRGLTHKEGGVTVTPCMMATGPGAGSGFPHSWLSPSRGPSLSQALPRAALPGWHHHTHTPPSPCPRLQSPGVLTSAPLQPPRQLGSRCNSKFPPAPGLCKQHFHPDFILGTEHRGTD